MSWEAGSTIVLALVLLAGFAWYERSRPPARILALVATLAALAVVGRLAFAAVPNVKPTTDIVLFAGFALGAVPGFAVGAVTAIVSNVFLSQGPWTPWQMAGWGAVGIGGALFARLMRGCEPKRILLAAVCGAAGLAFGAWMDIYQWTLAARQDLDTYLAVSASSLPYNVAHALGNVVFCLLIGPVFIRALRRYRQRLEVRWPARAGTAAAALLIVLLLVPASAGAASPAQRAERWLVRAQNADGGFGAAQGQRSSPLFSGWAGLALAAAGRNPRDVSRRNGRSLTAYLARGAALRDIGEVERTILVLEAAGLRSQSFRGRDLVAAVDRRLRPDGSIAGFVSYTAFGVLALQAAGEPPGGSTVRWLIDAQNDDGGFGVSPATPSDSDLTGAALQALAAVGRSQGGARRAAVAWLRAAQNPDGGFGQTQGQSSNSQSTSYAVQGLVAAGNRGATLTRALRYLRQRQRDNGSIAYSSTSSQTPVWVTAQALMALARKPLPLAAVARAEPDPEPVPEEPPAPRSDAAPAPPTPSEPDEPAQAPARSPDGDQGDGAEPSAPGDGAAQAPPAPSDGGQGIEEDAPLSTDDGGLQLDPRGDAAGDPGPPGPPAFLVVLAALMAAALLFLARRRLPGAELRARLMRRSPQS